MKKIWDRYWGLIIFGFLFIVIISMYYINGIWMKNVLKNSKYTVANITSNWHQKNNNGVGTDFEYFIDGKHYNYTTYFNLRKGTKYLVMYDSLKPSNCIMLGHHQLPDSIKSPKNGWKFSQVPIPIDSIQIKEYVEKYK